MKTFAAKTTMAVWVTRFFLLCSILFMPTLLCAASDISASYVQSQGRQLVIELTAGPNPPASAILIQRFPAGVTMLSSQPPASRYTPGNDKAKWLLRDMQPGKSRISMTLDRSVSTSEISAEIRVKPQQGGGVTTIVVGK